MSIVVCPSVNQHIHGFEHRARIVAPSVSGQQVRERGRGTQSERPWPARARPCRWHDAVRPRHRRRSPFDTDSCRARDAVPECSRVRGCARRVRSLRTARSPSSRRPANRRRSPRTPRNAQRTSPLPIACCTARLSVSSSMPSSTRPSEANAAPWNDRLHSRSCGSPYSRQSAITSSPSASASAASPRFRWMPCVTSRAKTSVIGCRCVRASAMVSRARSSGAIRIAEHPERAARHGAGNHPGSRPYIALYSRAPRERAAHARDRAPARPQHIAKNSRYTPTRCARP